MTGLFLLSGFLGSGKTTLMVEAAKILESRGCRTSVITNDQTGSLVDTAYARSENLSVREISGGCFCCRFPDFLETVRDIAESNKPDYIIAEAVGSCTDLVSTVIQPLLTFHGDVIKIMGFLTMADGPRLNNSFEGADLVNPAEPREILLSHQMTEASVLILSKVDLLKTAEREKAHNFLKRLNPLAEIIPCSSKMGEGMNGLIDKMVQGFSLETLNKQPLDYDVYARAEAEYGWYNGSWIMKLSSGMSPQEMSFDIMDSFQHPDLGEVAHGKLLLLTPQGALKVSYVSGLISADGQIPPGAIYPQVKVFLNIRAACSPETLVKLVETIHEKLSARGYELSEYEMDSLVPSPPKPYYSAL